MLSCEFDSSLHVLWPSSIDPDDRHISLQARNAQRDVKIASLNRPVGEGMSFPIGVLSRPRLVRAPDTVEPASLNIRATSCSRVAARRGWRHWIDDGLRDL